ncbi:NAD(P)/FAD-dependent oxidoreductase [Kitasatospora sp. NPDC004723]|uniref:NAD(P)/FAD-dependent oxidoreductase n=1 Tax=Kitasatospora sp. NPDC004723 TaxID=3154288 RepID=UPI0033BADD37
MSKFKATIRAKAKDKRVEQIKRYLELNDYEVTVTADPKATDTVVTGVGPTPLKDPTIAQLAEQLGLLLPRKESAYDLVVIGGGPAGLAAAINARSLYGLSTLIIERYAPGGTAATSINEIDNYLGFDDGIESELLCHKAVVQAKKFGAEWLPSYGVTELKLSEDPKKTKHRITATNSEGSPNVTVEASLVLLATGLVPRKLTQKTAAEFEDQGIYYYALPGDAEGVTSKDTIIVIGGGDSAGRAALMFANKGAKVVMLIRGTAGKDMLKAVYDKVKADSNITVVDDTEAIEFKAATTANAKLTVSTGKTKTTTVTATYDVTAVYALISADPDTKWIEDAGVTVVRKTNPDGTKAKYGLVATDLDIYYDAMKDGTFDPKKHAEELKTVTAMATNKPGVFAAGDVRFRSERRIPSAVGEGTAAALAMSNYLLGKPEVLYALVGRAAPAYYLA